MSVAIKLGLEPYPVFQYDDMFHLNLECLMDVKTIIHCIPFIANVEIEDRVHRHINY